MSDIDEARREAIALAREARALRRALDDIGVGMTMRRRRMAVTLAALVVASMFLTDYHVQHCFLESTSDVMDFVCDASFPLHGHGGARHVLDGRFVGFLIYTAVFARATWWALRRPPIADDRRKERRG